MEFVGAKLVLVRGGELLTYLRDDKPGLPWAAMWDLPGGGREGDETAETCVLRELEEEFGLVLGAERLVWRQEMPSMLDPARLSVFFAGRITAAEVAAIRFGDEGQHWRMMPVADYLAEPRAIPELQRRVRVALGALGWSWPV
jgi:8-oxo-dGTP diphosphatase